MSTDTVWSILEYTDSLEMDVEKEQGSLEETGSVECRYLFGEGTRGSEVG